MAHTGSDSNAGTLPRPFKTIQKAANNAQAGDTITVYFGTYREMVRPAHSSVVGVAITLRPFKNETASLCRRFNARRWQQSPAR